MAFNISRFKEIERREYECEVVTPMFMGGADPQKAELRAAPIKGALRFWWRALYGSDDIESMKKSEAKIWGSPQNKSSVTVEIIAPDMRPVRKKLYKGNFNIYEYLAFKYRDGDKIREYFREGRFSIRLGCKKEYLEQVTNSLAFLVYFGGIGAKTRNGFGSFTCKGIEKPIFEKFKIGPLKSFTSLSEKSLLFDGFSPRQTWEDALAKIGNAYKQARFELKNKGDKRELIGKPFKQNESRHAKPYFLHVNKTPDDKYQGQILFLPYLYKSGPDDKRNRFQEYMDACEKINETIKREAKNDLAKT